MIVVMEGHLKIAEGLVDLMENKFQFGNLKFGLDPLISAVPVFGDILSALVSFYLVWIGYRMGIPEKEVNKMVRNILIDVVLGITPFIGDIADIFYKANSKNLKILKKYQYAVHPKVRVIS